MGFGDEPIEERDRHHDRQYPQQGDGSGDRSPPPEGLINVLGRPAAQPPGSEGGGNSEPEQEQSGFENDEQHLVLIVETAPPAGHGDRDGGLRADRNGSDSERRRALWIDGWRRRVRVQLQSGSLGPGSDASASRERIARKRHRPPRSRPRRHGGLTARRGSERTLGHSRLPTRSLAVEHRVHGERSWARQEYVPLVSQLETPATRRASWTSASASAHRRARSLSPAVVKALADCR